MPEPVKILCMYSGGLDSLGALYTLLTDPAYQRFALHVHHLHLRNIEKRTTAELTAVKNTLRYFRDHGYRKFFYTESSHDYAFMRKYFIFDTYWYAFLAANIITADPGIRHVAVGRTRTDTENAGSMVNARRGHEIFHATLPLELRFERSYIYPVAGIRKKEIWEMLPPDLRVLSWSCRRPVVNNETLQPCGQCHTCKEMAKIREQEQEA